MSLGLDTTVVVRLIVGKPRAQTALARSRLEDAVAQGEPVYVSDLVVAEAYYALCYHYELEKDAAQGRLLAMLSSGVVELEPSSSLPALEGARRPGLVDRLIAARYRSQGSLTLTFDRGLGRLDGVELLSGRRRS